MRHLSRRRFVASTVAAGVLGATASYLLPARPARAAPASTIRATPPGDRGERALLFHHLYHMAAGMMTTLAYRS